MTKHWAEILTWRGLVNNHLFTFRQTCTFSDPKRTADTRSHPEGTRSVIESQRFLFPRHHREATFLLLWRWLVAVACCCCCCSLLRPGAHHKHSCWSADLSQRDGGIWGGFRGSCSSCLREAWSFFAAMRSGGWLTFGLWALIVSCTLEFGLSDLFLFILRSCFLSWDAAEEVDRQFSTTDNQSDCLFVLQLKRNWWKTWIFTKWFHFVNISPSLTGFICPDIQTRGLCSACFFLPQECSSSAFPWGVETSCPRAFPFSFFYPCRKRLWRRPSRTRVLSDLV